MAGCGGDSCTLQDANTSDLTSSIVIAATIYEKYWKLCENNRYALQTSGHMILCM